MKLFAHINEKWTGMAKTVHPWGDTQKTNIYVDPTPTERGEIYKLATRYPTGAGIIGTDNRIYIWDDDSILHAEIEKSMGKVVPAIKLGRGIRVRFEWSSTKRGRIKGIAPGGAGNVPASRAFSIFKTLLNNKYIQRVLANPENFDESYVELLKFLGTGMRKQAQKLHAEKYKLVLVAAETKTKLNSFTHHINEKWIEVIDLTKVQTRFAGKNKTVLLHVNPTSRELAELKSSAYGDGVGIIDGNKFYSWNNVQFYHEFVRIHAMSVKIKSENDIRFMYSKTKRGHIHYFELPGKCLSSSEKFHLFKAIINCKPLQRLIEDPKDFDETYRGMYFGISHDKAKAYHAKHFGIKMERVA